MMRRECGGATPSGAKWLVLVVTIAVCAVALSGCGSDTTATTAPVSSTGANQPPSTSADAAPDFSGVTLDGSEVSLGYYRGKPLVLAFMASW